MSEQTSNLPLPALYLGLLIISGIAGVLVLATDFGGVYYAGYVVRTWEFINILNFPYNLVLIAIAGIFFYNLVIALLTLRDMSNPIPKLFFTIGLYLTFTGLILVILGAIALSIVGGLEADDWWFDAAFYGGIIGSVLNLMIYFLLVSNKVVSIKF